MRILLVKQSTLLASYVPSPNRRPTASRERGAASKQVKLLRVKYVKWYIRSIERIVEIVQVSTA